MLPPSQTPNTDWNQQCPHLHQTRIGTISAPTFRHQTRIGTSNAPTFRHQTRIGTSNAPTFRHQTRIGTISAPTFRHQTRIGTISAPTFTKHGLEPSVLPPSPNTDWNHQCSHLHQTRIGTISAPTFTKHGLEPSVLPPSPNTDWNHQCSHLHQTRIGTISAPTFTKHGLEPSVLPPSPNTDWNHQCPHLQTTSSCRTPATLSSMSPVIVHRSISTSPLLTLNVRRDLLHPTFSWHRAATVKPFRGVGCCSDPGRKRAALVFCPGWTAGGQPSWQLSGR